MYAGVMSSHNTRIQEHQHRDYTTPWSMVQSPSLEASWFAASQEIPRI